MIWICITKRFCRSARIFCRFFAFIAIIFIFHLEFWSNQQWLSKIWGIETVYLLHAQIHDGDIILSESSVVTSYYFGWTTSFVAIFLACLDLTVLPINILVGSYISNMFEDRYMFEPLPQTEILDHMLLGAWYAFISNCRQILLTSEIIVFIGILFSFNLFVPYTVPQYVISCLVMFVAAEVLEGIQVNKPLSICVFFKKQLFLMAFVLSI